MAKIKIVVSAIMVICAGVMFGMASSQEQACNPDDFLDGETLPEIPSKFFTRIECNMAEKKKSMEAHEYRVKSGDTEDMLDINFFGAKDNYFSLDRFILDVKKDESDWVTEGFEDGFTGSCVHFGPESKPQNEYFGFEAGDAEHLPGSGKIFTVTGAFQLASKHKFKTMECEPIRGIPCVAYQTCIKLDGRNPSTNVETTFFFSDKDKWIPADGAGAEVPLEIEVHWKEESGSDSVHVYELTNFMESYVHENDQALFTPPSSVYCPNRLPPHPFHWQPPDTYELDVEVVNFQMGTNGQFEKEFIQEYRQYFDKTHKYDRFDFDGEPKKFGEIQIAQPLTVIHDFNTGHAYTIFRAKEECEITKLTVESGFDVTVGNGQLTISNPWSFLNGSEYSYQGVHYNRGIKSDVYVFPTEVEGKKLLISLYAANDQVEDDESLTVERVGPVHIRIRRATDETGNREELPPTEMNIFDYQSVQPSLHAWTIRTCFRGPDESQFVSFVLEGIGADWIIEPVRHWIYYEVMSKLHSVVQVAPIRINDIHIADDSQEGILVVAFDLLEKPPVDGSGSPDFPNVPLAEAYKNLQANYENVEFEIPYMLPDTGTQVHYKTMKPKPGSLENIEQDLEGSDGGSGGFSGGSMAGLGIGMILVGAALGFGLVKFEQYRRGNLAGLPQLGKA